MKRHKTWAHLLIAAWLIVLSALAFSGCALATLAGKVVTEHPCDTVTCPAGERCYETATASDNMSGVKAVCAPAPVEPGTPEPTPTPTPPACPDLGVPWCHEAGMQCGACKHQPPGEACPIMAPACPEVPPVKPPVTPPATPGCSLDGVIDPDTITGVEPKPAAPARLGDDVNAVQAQLTGCQPQSGDCVVGAYDPWVAKVAAGLRAQGWCVGTKIHPDALAVSDPADLSLNYAVHVHNAGGDKARWWPSAYVDAWRAPKPACGAPVPPGVGRITLDVYRRPNRTIVDASLVVRSCEYCAAIGMGTMGGLPRCGCPVRPEGHPERIACEALFPLTWSGPGHATDNPAQHELEPAEAGTVTACAGGVCESIEVTH